MKTFLFLLISHALALGAGFGLGIYTLPLLTAPAGPGSNALGEVMQTAAFTGEFRRDLAGSDLLHWGEGTVYVAPDAVAFSGSLAPGPDYRLYLSPVFVETEAEFHAARTGAIQVGEVRTFENFLVALPPGVDPARYTTVVVWCESFGQFITAAEYRQPPGE